MVDEKFDGPILVLSNGSSISPSLEELMRKLNLKISFSIDAFGDKNDYIRFPSKFSVIEKNVLRFKDILFRIFITISSVNVLDVGEIIEWCERNEVQTHFDVVLVPITCLSPLTLPRNIRVFAAKKLKDLMRKNLKYTDPNLLESFVRSLLSSYERPDMKEFWSTIKRFDDRRGTNFLETFPSWKRFANVTG